jgi:hypothetical protein
MQDEKMQDEKITRAIKLFRDAWTLLANLEELQLSLPAPNMVSARPLPPDWDDSRSYAVCVDTLQSSLSFVLNANILPSLAFRNEWHILNTLKRPDDQQKGA